VSDAEKTWRRIAEQLRLFPVIPAVRTAEDAREAIARPGAAVLVFKGTIFMLREVIQLCGPSRPVLVHMDLLEGVGKDEAGLRLLAELGVGGVASTRAHLVKQARKQGLAAIQRLFAIDSDALATGIVSAREATPHAVEVLPGLVVAHLMPALGRDLGLPVIAAGLLSRLEHLQGALTAGAGGVSTSARSLWGLGRAQIG
jgi:glycerol uptake operon antiterminator